MGGVLLRGREYKGKGKVLIISNNSLNKKRAFVTKIIHSLIRVNI